MHSMHSIHSIHSIHELYLLYLLYSRTLFTLFVTSHSMIMHFIHSILCTQRTLFTLFTNSIYNSLCKTTTKPAPKKLLPIHYVKLLQSPLLRNCYQPIPMGASGRNSRQNQLATKSLDQNYSTEF